MDLEKNQEEQEFSLWVIPEDKVFDRLAKTMSELREIYQGPVFDPHVTLLGKLNLPPERVDELVGKTEKLSKMLDEYPLEIRELECLPEFYFKCLFARVSLTHEVRTANLMAQGFFRSSGWLNHPENYEPHLSLVYGNLNGNVKKDVIKKYGKSLDLDFTAKRVYLYSTEGGPTRWYKVQEFPFGGS